MIGFNVLYYGSVGRQVNERQREMNLLVNVCFLPWTHTSKKCLLDIRKFTEFS